MARLVIVALFASVSLLGIAPSLTPAIAGDACSAWTYQSEEDEGGPVMVASSCPDEENDFPALRLMCFDQVNVRYDVGSDGEGLLQPGDTAGFEFVVGTEKLTVQLIYEDMDGALAAYVDKTDALVKLLQSGEELQVNSLDYDLVPRMVSLKGSGKAIESLLANCG